MSVHIMVVIMPRLPISFGVQPDFDVLNLVAEIIKTNVQNSRRLNGTLVHTNDRRARVEAMKACLYLTYNMCPTQIGFRE